MKEELWKKIASLPEDVQQLLLEMPNELLIYRLGRLTLPEMNQQMLSQVEELFDDLQSKMKKQRLLDQKSKNWPPPGAFRGKFLMAEDIDDSIPESEEN
jgi:hypothetical protein